jgi:cytochrome b
MPQSQAQRQKAPEHARVLELVASAPAEVVTPLSPPSRRIALWDLPLRIFHWSLLAAVSTAIVTGLLGGSWMPVHGKAGLTIAGLLAFRVIWGFVGSTHSRFASFVPTPGKLLNYVRGRWLGVGHNPLGALSVLALLGLLSVQVGTGLVGNDDIAFTGPLASLVDEALSTRLTGLHHQLATVLYVLLGLHVAAIAFYGHVKKHKLVKPMVTGWKDVDEQVGPPRRARPRALVAALLIAFGAVYLASGSWITTPSAIAAPGNTPAAKPSPSW